MRKSASSMVSKSWRAVVGNHAILEALRVHADFVEVAWLKPNFESVKELRDLENELTRRQIKIEIKSEIELSKLAQSHQGAAVFVSKTCVFDWTTLLQKRKVKLILLDGVEDPHNLGAVVRTAWLMGVNGILIPQDRCVKLTPSVHKVASGGVEHVPIESVNNFNNVIEDLKKNGFWVYGLSHLGKKQLFDLKLPDKIVWVIGAEDKGLRSSTERFCDELIRIPQLCAAASYNASVAAAIALTETSRQLGI